MNAKNKAVLVTGASKGLGEALSAELARRGARVVMVARGEEALRAAAARITREGGEAHALAFDIADKNTIHALALAAADRVGDIDILVNNASTLGPLPMPLLLDTACEDLEDVLATNLIGPFRLTKVVAGGMLLRGAGVVVSVSSDASVEAYPRWGAYSISKAATDHMTRVLAAEAKAVRFFSVDPGEMDTQMHADAMPEADRSQLQRPEAVARIVATMIESGNIASGARLSAPSWSAS